MRSNELEVLKRYWPKVEKQFARRRTRILRAIPKDDPLHLEVDLLGPIRCASDEVLHTQALAYALEPREGHRFAKRVLICLLEFLRDKYPRSGVARVLKIARKAGARVTVKSEYRYRVEGYRDRSIARSDIWIEIQVAKRSAVIVIENKINSGESDEQLTWYERKAKAWCKARGHDRLALVFLSKEGKEATTSEDGRWVALSYLELAAVLRKVWAETRPALGAQWLALYIASIVRGLLDIDLRKTDSFTPFDIAIYLGKR